QDGASRTFAPIVAGGLQVQTHSQAVVAAHEERDNEQDEREDRYSSRADEAQSGAPIEKRYHKERLTTGETRLDVLEASFPLRLMKAPRVTSSQEEAESRIDKVESLVNRLTEDTKDSVQHLHEVVEELMSKRRKRGGVVCLEVGQVRGRVTELARRDAGSVEEGDQVAGVDAEGDGKSRREREREREREEMRKRGGGMGLCIWRLDRCMGGRRSLSRGIRRRQRRATKRRVSTRKVMERIDEAQGFGQG
ncbi:hypothetical protein BHM03_00042436, partial [Ensete ventricosum]